MVKSFGDTIRDLLISLTVKILLYSKIYRHINIIQAATGIVVALVPSKRDTHFYFPYDAFSHFLTSMHCIYTLSYFILALCLYPPVHK